MKTKVISHYLVIIVLAFFLFQTACNKTPETIGLDILDESKLGVYDTSFSIVGYSTIDDSVRTDELSNSLLGSMQTEDFGLTNARFYSHLRLSSTSPSFGENPQPDSAILTLVYNGYYGYINTPLSVHVYEVMEDFNQVDTAYSNTTFNLEPYTELGSLSFVPNPSDSIMQEDSTYVSGGLRIPLNETFINKMLFPSDDSVYSSSNNFVEYFKGIFVFTSVVTSPNEGSILYFNLLNPRSNVTLYYNDSLSFEYQINSNCATVGNYHHNFSKSLNQNFKDQILNGDTLKGSENLYLQGLAGTKTKFHLHSLAGWVGTNKYAVNEATLVIPVVEPVEELAPPEQLLLFQYDESGNIQFPADVSEGDNYFGGKYNETSKSYEFRITLYVQSVLDGTPDYGLALYTSGKAIKANQVVLYGTEPENTAQPKMYLNLIYTLLE